MGDISSIDVITEMDEKTTTQVENVEKLSHGKDVCTMAELVDSISNAVQTAGVNLKAVEVAMKSYFKSGSSDWKRFAFWDECKNYTRNLIATDYDTFGLMLLCWNARKASAIHDHAGSECFMLCLDGQVSELRYSTPIDGSTPELVKTTPISAGEVAFINDSIGLHKVENSTTEKAVTLHLYLPLYQSCRLYLESSSETVESFVTFYSESGRRVECDE